MTDETERYPRPPDAPGAAAGAAKLIAALVRDDLTEADRHALVGVVCAVDTSLGMTDPDRWAPTEMFLRMVLTDLSMRS